jgi:hypothetical protein
MELLFTVEDHFLIKGRGLLVHHVIDNPNDWRFKPFSDEVVIRRPDGAEDRLLVSFAWGWGHGIGGPPMIYDLCLIFSEGTKETIPVRSQIFVSEGIWRKLHGEVPNKLERADA